MKKFGGYLLAVWFGVAACKGPMGPEGPPGRDGNNGIETLWSVEYYPVKEGDWMRVDFTEGNIIVASYYESLWEAPQITEDHYYDGLIICYLLYLDEDGYDVQTVLPYTYYSVDNSGVPYSVEYSFNVQPTVDRTPGNIAFRLTPNDLRAWELSPPPSCLFRLALVY